jgi:hypothetical protein
MYHAPKVEAATVVVVETVAVVAVAVEGGPSGDAP